MSPADATDFTDAGAVALNRDRLLCRSSRLAVNPPTPTRDCIHNEKIRADIAPKKAVRRKNICINATKQPADDRQTGKNRLTQ
jgi:hypothetical protein|tara:strand:- start:183 stop:431 length:249 start_codon:yes stop_codon:yes gene_type:complete